MKRAVYIIAFTFLGVLLQFLIHAGIEIPVIFLLLKDFETFGLGLTWDQWVMIHDIGTIVFFAAGAAGGFLLGRYWWRVIYIEKRLRKNI